MAKVKLMVIIDDEYIEGYYTMYIGTKSKGLKYMSDCLEGIADCFKDHIKHNTKFRNKENKINAKKKKLERFL